MNWDDLEKKYGGSSGSSGGSWDELEAKYTKAAQPAKTITKAEPQPVTDFSGNLRLATPFGTLDTRLPLPDIVNKGLAQFGSGIADWGLGARQMVASDKPSQLGDLVTGQSDATRLQQEAADKRKLDAELNKGWMGTGLNFAGKVAPSLAIPAGYLGIAGKAAPIIEGALAGGGMSAFQPTVQGESRAANIGLGAAGGAAIPAAIAGVKALAKPADAGAVAIADKYGIPVGVSDASQNGFLKGLRSVLNDTPIVGIGGRAQDEAKQQAFNKAVGKTFGADATKLTPEVMDSASKQVKGTLNKIWEGNTLNVDDGLMAGLTSIRQKAAEKLLPEQAAQVDRQIQSLLQKVDSNGQIPGGFANNFQSELRMLAEGEKGLHQSILQDLRKTVVGAFNRSVSGDDAAALSLARGQYKNLKTVQPLLDKGAVGVAGREAGDVPAALLPEAVRKSFPNLSGNTSPPALAELAQVGSKYVASRVPQTGGAPRALVQNGLLGGGLAGLAGSGAGLATTGGVAAGGGTLAALLNQALGSNAVRKALTAPTVTRGLLSPAEMDLLAKEALRRGILNAPAAALTGYLAVPAATLE